MHIFGKFPIFIGIAPKCAKLDNISILARYRCPLFPLTINSKQLCHINILLRRVQRIPRIGDPVSLLHVFKYTINRTHKWQYERW